MKFFKKLIFIQLSRKRKEKKNKGNFQCKKTIRGN